MSAILRLNSSGLEVEALQRALRTAGFNPGAVSGTFDQATEAAVLAFQRSEALAPDGIVGPSTAKALGLSSIPSSPSAVPGLTVQIVCQMFPSTAHSNIAANLPFVLEALVSASICDKPMVLMALSTIRAETESFEPVCEAQSRFNTSPTGPPFDLYDYRKDLGNTGPPDGATFRGRGFVQLTGKANYTRYGAKIAKDFLATPDLAADLSVAAELLSVFLKDREDHIREAIACNNLATARWLVNGGHNGLDRFVDAFEIGAKLIPGPAAAMSA
jgi:putative chitinase